MRLVVVCGVFLLCLLVFMIGTILPDTTERSFFSALARTAASAKHDAIMNSPEMQALDGENERLHEELRALQVSCPATPMGWKGRLAGLLPFLD